MRCITEGGTGGTCLLRRQGKPPISRLTAAYYSSGAIQKVLAYRCGGDLSHNFELRISSSLRGHIGGLCGRPRTPSQVHSLQYFAKFSFIPEISNNTPRGIISLGCVFLIRAAQPHTLTRHCAPGIVHCNLLPVFQLGAEAQDLGGGFFTPCCQYPVINGLCRYHHRYADYGDKRA